MAYRRLLELQESHQSYRTPTPPPNADTVDQALLALERKTRNLQQEASQDREVRRHRPQRPPMNNKNRYSRSSPTEEERDRALDQHAERMYHRKLQTQMFGEDLSTSKLSKKRGKKVRAPEKLQQLKEEHLNTVPYRPEHQRLRMARTTAMFGEDLSRKSSTRRAPAQPSLVGAQKSEGMMGEERRQYRMYPDEDEETVYVTLEELHPHRRKQAAAILDSEKNTTKLPSLAPQRHSLTGKRTAADRPALKDPKPPVAAMSDNAMVTQNMQTKKRASHRRTRDSRAPKRRCESPSGAVLSKH
ncbi:uncharacterized protein LOC118424290 [Branchiostoma floridae]|uniref:Uncharacterized protein LOC118424290 n=1 Tax=Branchiostoma floridae TaxID=7739 RepID=A0A9J7N1X8_BRAFL|nr:uncharacterized protein LOC118424290 [Branchiostoma floridae]XP_035688730.1 uncharacterized protein LOC118424290 [Branchiostoma floridae]XP_035688731.1 uncharacterized protein LOC118424290 [Branchiostoma floridae]